MTRRSAHVSLVLLALPVLATAGHARQDEDEGWERQEPEFRRIERTLVEGRNSFLGRGGLAELEAEVTDPSTPAARRAKLVRRLARASLKQGAIDRALELYGEAVADPELRGAERARVTALLALAWLRKAENENCIALHEAECCVFPLAGGAIHRVREPAQAALALYLELLESSPDDLELRWLANIAAMALGEHPGALPEAQRIPRAAFASEGELGRFRDVATELGVDTFNLCGGVVVEDFDGDGHLDVLTSTYDPGGGLTFYRATGDGRFEDRSEASHASDQLGGLNLVAADYDDDGDPDVLVLRGAWLGNDGRIRNSLLRNDEGVFVDVTRAAGMGSAAYPTQTAVWGDFDGDGDLDVFVPSESRGSVDPSGDFPDQLYVNRGDGTFRDEAAARGLRGGGFTKGASAGDYDDDGDLDLYLSNIGPNQLFRNDGEGRFTDVAAELGVTGPAGRSFATWFFDHDNDGDLDLFVAAYESSVVDLAAEALGREHGGEPPRLYRNDGDGSFTDVAAAVGLAHPFQPMGANFGDVDQDGFLDVYLTTGEPQLQSLMPNAMFRNAGGTRFLDVTTAGGFGHLQKGHGVGFADLDGDGDQDVYHQLGGFFPVDRYQNALFENPGNGNRFLYVEPVGVESNRDGIGVRLEVVVEEAGEERSIHRAVGAVSSFGGSPLRQEIGLGRAERVVSLTLVWPTSGETQRFEDVPLDAWVRVVEGEAELKRVPLPRVTLGGSAR